MNVRPTSWFVIATLSRSGGHMFESALNMHPQVESVGEILSHKPCEAGPEPVQKVEYHLRRPGKPIRGFRCMAFHPTDAFRSMIPDFKVIYLCRMNVIRQIVSHEIARKTNQWVLREDEDRQTVSVNIPAMRVWRSLAERTNCYRILRETFRDYPSITVSYERLVANTEGEMARVLRFLEVDPFPVYPATRKQNPEPIRELLQNYDELKAEFENTPYAVYFRE